jgi:hypothetical protein
MLPNNEEYFEKYPPADKQFPSNLKYTEYESIQTGATGKVIN